MDTKTRKKSIFIFILIILVACFIVVLVQVLPLIWETMNDDDRLYEKNINKVVEVVAYDEEEEKSYGTGWFYNSELIYTNYHVVSQLEAEERVAFSHVEIRFYDQEEYEEVTIVNVFETTDCVFLSYQGIHERDSFTEAQEYETGEEVYAIGNFLNYGLSFRKGYISNKAIYMDYNNRYEKYIQCAMSIGPGDSGAPLFNKQGDIVGIITFRTRNSRGEVEQGFGYAIPNNRF